MVNMSSGVRSPKDIQGHPIDLGAIADLLDRILRAWHTTRISPFGSRARGDAGSTSDWDLLVVVPGNTAGVDDPLAGWRLKSDAGVPSDLVLCRESGFQEDRDTPNTLAFEASHGGALIYER